MRPKVDCRATTPRFEAACRPQRWSVVEKNGWHTVANWPPESKALKYFLHGSHELSTSPPSAASVATTYRFDPAIPVPTAGGANLRLDIGPVDQRQIAEREDYLRFQTPALESDVTLAGSAYLDLYASSDAPDTDFMVKLVDVYPDGYEALILDAPLRAMYREGRRPEQIKKLEASKPTRMKVELGGTANTFEKGHRIAVHISSSNHPRFEVNSNTGDLPGTSPSPPRVAVNTIHHDAEHPTALVLSVVE